MDNLPHSLIHSISFYRYVHCSCLSARKESLLLSDPLSSHHSFAISCSLVTAQLSTVWAVMEQTSSPTTTSRDGRGEK